MINWFLLLSGIQVFELTEGMKIKWNIGKEKINIDGQK